MTDVILALSQNPFARSLAQRAKLPIPLPEKLDRQEGPSPERPLEDKSVFVRRCREGFEFFRSLSQRRHALEAASSRSIESTVPAR